MVDFRKLAQTPEEREKRIDQIIREQEEKREKEAKRLQGMIEDLDRVATVKLTSWEIRFVGSVEGQLERQAYLSDKQVEVLEKIHRERLT